MSRLIALSNFICATYHPPLPSPYGEDVLGLLEGLRPEKILQPQQVVHDQGGASSTMLTPCSH